MSDKLPALRHRCRHGGRKKLRHTYKCSRFHIRYLLSKHMAFYISPSWGESHVLMSLWKMTVYYGVCPFSVNGNDILILASLQSRVSDTKSVHDRTSWEYLVGLGDMGFYTLCHPSRTTFISFVGLHFLPKLRTGMDSLTLTSSSSRIVRQFNRPTKGPSNLKFLEQNIQADSKYRKGQKDLLRHYSPDFNSYVLTKIFWALTMFWRYRILDTSGASH